MVSVRIKHDVVIVIIVVVLALCIVGLVITGVDTDNLCTPPRNIGLYQPIGLGAGSVFSRIIAFNTDVNPLTVLPSGDEIVEALYVQDDVHEYASPKVSSLLWAWLRFLEHDLVLTKRTNDTQRDDYILDSHNNSQQINYASPYIDLSQIYGNTFQQAMAIRRDDGTGKLITSESSYVELEESVLPYFDNHTFDLVDSRHGDDLIVDALYALFIREHNYWCDRIFSERPHLLGYDYYFLARSIVIAEVQAITYRTVLPLLIGDTININVPCFSSVDEQGKDYPVDHYVRRVSVHNEFAMGVLPVYLTLEVGTTLGNNTENDAYLWHNGIGDVLKNASWTQARKRDIVVDDALLELASQRIYGERDHEIPPYQSYYHHYMHDTHVACQRYAYDRSLCAEVAAVFTEGTQVDLLTGVLLERKFTSQALLGSVAAHVFADQFTYIKRNDHYFYLWNEAVKPYLSEIHHVSLAKIILRNTLLEITDLQPDVFKV